MRAILLAATLLLLPGIVRAATLFDALGGHAGLVRLVDAALARSLVNPRIKAVFEETSIPRLKRLAVEHLCHVTDGGCVYSGRDMRTAHAGLGLQAQDFDAVTEDLRDAMNEQGLPSAVQDRLLARLAPMQRDVVSK